MFIGVYLIMVFDPQILFNDGFYPLLHVVIPEGSLLQPEVPVGARLPHARADAALRRPRRRARQQGPELTRRPPATARAPTCSTRAGTADGEFYYLDGDPRTAAFPAGRSATGWTATRGGRCSRTSRPSTSRPTTRCGSTATRRSTDSGGAGHAPRRQRRREALRLPRAGRGLDPRRPLAHPPVGHPRRQAGRRARRRSCSAPTGRASGCRRSATTSRSSRATCSSTAPRAAAAGRTRSTAGRDGRARRCEAGSSRREKARDGLRRRRRRRGRDRGAPRRAGAARGARRGARLRLRAALDEILARAKEETGIEPPCRRSRCAGRRWSRARRRSRRVREHGDRQSTGTE